MSKIHSLWGKLTYPLNNQRGSVHILIFALLAICAMVWVWTISFNWMMQTLNDNNTKPLIDQATRAATLDIDPVQAARGNIVWDSIAGTNSFYKYLRLNLKLDSSNNPVAGSMLQQAPIVHDLELVTDSSYPYLYHKSITLYAGTAGQTTRNVDVTIYGPSVLAIVEVRQNLIGLGRAEPIVISSVASVRFK